MTLKLQQKLLNSKIYGFTPDKYCGERKILDVIEQQCAAGIDIIQLREKKMSAREKLSLAAEIRKIADKYGTIFIVNDDILIAKISEADGVHLGQDDLSPEIAREILGEKKIIGLSTHNFEQYSKAQLIDVDYTAIGPIFATKTKDNPSPVVGITNLNHILSNKKKFTVAIGGINIDNILDLKKYPLDCLAIVSGIVNSANIKERICELLNIYQ